MEKKIVIFFVMMLLGLSISSAATCTQISQYNITWFFDKAYTCGQFVNGDFWVVGPVNITSVTPAWDGARHGSMIDPSANGVQGYDSRINAYYTFNDAVRAKFPLFVNGNHSLVSVISLAQNKIGGAYEALDSAAVLTIVSENVPNNTFRPSYVSGYKTFYNKNQVNYNLLPSLSIPQGVSLPNYNEIMKRVWLNHGPQVWGATIRPSSNMPSYSRDSAFQVSDISLLVLLNISDKEELVNRLIQVGIDHYGIALQNGDSFSANGGHSNGFKWPILFAGIMLNDSALKNPPLITISHFSGGIVYKFGEDGQTYYKNESFLNTLDKYGYPQKNIGNWLNNVSALWRINDDPYYKLEYQHKNPQYWTEDGRGRTWISPNGTSVNDPASGANSDYRSESYRQCCTSYTWIGEALAARILGAENIWNHSAFFDYADSWMLSKNSNYLTTVNLYPNEKFVSDYQGTSLSPIVDAMWNTYRNYSVSDNDASLVAFWKFDEGSGNIFHDQTGLNGQGYTNNASWVNGKVNGALSFTGANNSYARINSTSALANLTRFSLSAWVKVNPNKTGRQEIFQRGVSYFMSGTISLYYYNDIGRFVFEFYDGNINYRYAYSPAIFDFEEWHNVVVVAKNDSVRIYVDGFSGLPIEVNNLSPLEDGRGDLNKNKGTYIGSALTGASSNLQDYFNGSIDEIRMYNRDLSSSEVMELYGSNSLAYTSDFSISINTTPWPRLFGQVGGYGIVNSQDIIDMASNDFHLYYGGYSSPNTAIGQAVISNNMSVIVSLVNRLYQVCPTGMNQCTINSSDEQSILSSVQTILNQTAQDPHVVGYWILDDSPGDVRNIIQKIHDLVALSNNVSIFPRPAICGLSGGLDYKLSFSQKYFTSAGVAVASLQNINSTNCDAIGLYLYGVNFTSLNDSRLSDWSMQNYLPQVFAGLRSVGWNQSKQPLIALPHAFSLESENYVLPSAAEVAIQSEAYCKAGAIALLPYAWHTSLLGSTHALWDTPDLVTGLKQGMQACQNKYWAHIDNLTNYHIADTNTDNNISSLELNNYISGYFSGSYNLKNALYLITLKQKGGKYNYNSSSSCDITPWNCYISV